MVIHNDAHAITPRNLNGWPRSAAVVTPKIDNSARNDFLLHWLRNEVEFLDLSIHPKWQVRHIGRLDKNGSAVGVVGLLHSPLSFRLRSLHPVGHIHLLGGEHSRGCKHACSRQNMLQKPAPAAHIFPFQDRMTELSKVDRI